MISHVSENSEAHERFEPFGFGYVCMNFNVGSPCGGVKCKVRTAGLHKPQAHGARSGSL